jgi:hypothetical protein
MGRSQIYSAISFRKINPIPSEIIPGGTVVEEAHVPWIDGSIGTVVRLPTDDPPHCPWWGPTRTLWYFIPTNSTAPTVECDTIPEGLHSLINEAYRGIYDNRNTPRGTFIASGDDYEIVGNVIAWAGLSERWSENNLCDRHDFWREVLMECDNVVVKSKNWEGGGPGLSDVWFIVRSMNAKELRKEIAHWFDLMVERDKVELEQAKLLAEAKEAAKEATRKAKKKARAKRT